MPSDRYSRQSFLGDNAERIFSTVRLGIVGLGGGGSHIAQQAAHIGFQKISVFDFDTVCTSNLNRLVGAVQADAEAEVAKGAVCIRQYRGLQPTGDIRWMNSRWQDAKSVLRDCDLVMTSPDDIANRLDIEKTCRRHLVPMIDIGMDINCDVHPPRCVGQIALSMPGGPCLHCLGFRDEAKKPNYGDGAPKPQVVWSNGVLASAAIGLAVEMLTGWTGRTAPCFRLLYDGNTHTVKPMADIESRLLIQPCEHFPPDAVGDLR